MNSLVIEFDEKKHLKVELNLWCWFVFEVRAYILKLLIVTLLYTFWIFLQFNNLQEMSNTVHDHSFILHLWESSATSCHKLNQFWLTFPRSCFMLTFNIIWSLIFDHYYLINNSKWSTSFRHSSWAFVFVSSFVLVFVSWKKNIFFFYV